MNKHISSSSSKIAVQHLTFPVAVGIICLVFVMTGTAQTTRYVSLAGSGEAPYTSLATAATTIQDAVDEADQGDTILVAAGVYDQGGRKAPGMGLLNRVCITKALTLESLEGPNVTEIRGQGPKGSSAVRCMFVTNGVTVVGFTLSEGSTATSSLQYLYDQSGGGVMFYRGGHLVDCTITDCSADRCGGGVHCAYAGLLERCVITGNSIRGGSGGEGAGVNLLYGGMLNDCVISSNTISITAYSSEPYGGGVFMAYGGELNRCIIRDNQAIGDYDNPHGGGVFIENSGDLNDCLIINNKSTADHDIAYGGGVYFYRGGRLNNCTVTGNEADRGGGAYKYSSGQCHNSILYGNSAGTGANHDNGVYMYYCCTTPLPSGTANIEQAPDFVATGDYRLMATSPCIDSGDPTLLTGVGQDGVPRPLDGDADGSVQLDMGAYEFVSDLADSDGDGITDGIEINVLNSNPTSANSDGDELDDMEEFIAGTDPSDPNACFEIAYNPDLFTPGHAFLEWPSFTNRYYNIYWSNNLTNGFTNLVSNLEHPVSSYTDTEHGDEEEIFYVVEVRLK
jgi:hypothetical protein